MPLRIARTLGPDERILLDETPLGRGGTSLVYGALFRPTRTRVAVKLLSDEHMADPSARLRFGDEVAALSRIRHPGVVRLIEWGEEQNLLYLVYEFIDGPSILQELEVGGPFLPERAVSLARQTLVALEAVHRAGILHRDLKSENILLEGGATPRLIDFGLARGEGPRRTAQGRLVGTPGFLAPERILGQEADARSDLYSVGVLLFEMLTGKVPYTGGSTLEVMKAHVEAAIPLPSQVRRGTPRGLDRIVQKAMAKRPDERYQDAEAFQRALDGFAAAIAPLSRPPLRAT